MPDTDLLTQVRDPYADSAARFAADTTNHVMTVLHDDGLYRHLRFKAPGTGFYWFDLVTWPGRLSFSGDMDGYTFARELDMFGFFRSHKSLGYSINPGYWSEKVDGGRDSTKTFSEEKFRQLVTEHIDDIADGYPAGLRAAVKDEILDDPDGMAVDQPGARQLLDDFEYRAVPYENVERVRGVLDAVAAGLLEVTAIRRRTNLSAPSALHILNELIEAGLVTTSPWGRQTHYHLASDAAAARQLEFRFTDTWEWDFTDYNWSFLWACHAIVWGIRQYDAARTAPATTSAVVTVELPTEAVDA